MQKIYLAGSCSSEQRTMMRKIAERLRSSGYAVYCPFELKIPNAWDMSQEDWSQKVFDADVKALDDCDIFLMISPGRYGTAGTNWEQGYAYAKKKRIIVIQFTTQQTSLMTYIGSTVFINTSVEEIEDSLELALRRTSKEPCRTVLT